jgi:hypothetical protein
MTPATLADAVARGELRHPTVEHRAMPCGQGSGLAVVTVDAYGREHVYVTPNAMEILERLLQCKT